MPNKGRLINALIHIFVDFLVVSFLFILIFWDASMNIPSAGFTPTIIYYCIAVIFKLVIFAFLGLYAMITSHFSIVDAIKVGIVSTTTTIIVYVIMFFLPFVKEWTIIHFVLLLLSEAFLLISTRFVKRLLNLYMTRKERSGEVIRTILIGAGSGAKLIMDEFRSNRELLNQVVALVDDDKDKIGSSFSGIKVVGPVSKISAFIKEFKATEVIIAIANINKQRLFEIISFMDQDDVKIKRLPLMTELSGDKKQSIMEVDINELLGRDVIPLENDEIRGFIENKIILITGAGGSIGSELARQVYRYNPKQMVLFDIYENSIYDLQQEFVRLQNHHKDKTIPIKVIIGSTYDRARVEQIFSEYKPEIVFHAAAYKHVPLMEDNPQEAIRTNILGTYNVAFMADKYQVSKMLLVSTDKAVRPTNVMGATKAFAEIVISHFSTISKTTSFSMVRFGNVLGSNGSVIPLFKKQIEAGGPLTVTDPRITRFFMTIPESVGLILQTTVYAQGGEIFVLDMGKPIKITDLAEKMIRQAGFIPYKDIKIQFIGLRPGEKLYEELLTDVKTQVKTKNNKIFIESKSVLDFSKDDFEGLVNHLADEPSSLVKKLFIAIKMENNHNNNHGA